MIERPYTKARHPAWKKGDRVVSLISCAADKLYPGHVGTVHVDFRRTPRMEEWTRVWVKWDYSGLLDAPLPWEIDYETAKCETGACQRDATPGDKFCEPCRADVEDFKRTGKVNYT